MSSAEVVARALYLRREFWCGTICEVGLSCERVEYRDGDTDKMASCSGRVGQGERCDASRLIGLSKFTGMETF